MINTFNLNQRGIAWWILLLEGIAAFILGLFLLLSPVRTAIIITIAFGLYLLVMGIFSLIDASNDVTNRGWKIFSGIVGLLGGLIVIRNPLWSALFIPSTAIIYLSILGVIYGVIHMIVGFRGMDAGAVATGLVGAILSIVLFLVFPLFVVALPFILGICGIIGGIITAVMALRLRNQPARVTQTTY